MVPNFKPKVTDSACPKINTNNVFHFKIAHKWLEISYISYLTNIHNTLGFCTESYVATSVLRMCLLHARIYAVAFSKKLCWLAQTKVISLKMQPHTVNARWKRLSQHFFRKKTHCNAENGKTELLRTQFSFCQIWGSLEKSSGR